MKRTTRIALLSDIHSNSLALNAVLQHASSQSIDEYWCLGDLVGYGSDPVPVLDWFSKLSNASRWVMGNHDAMAADMLPPGDICKNGHILFHIEKSPRGEFDLLVGTSFLNEYEWNKTSQDAALAVWMNYQALLQPEVECQLEFFKREYTNQRLHPCSVERANYRFLLGHGSFTHSAFWYVYPWHKNSVQNELKYLLSDDPASKKTIVGILGHTHIPFIAKGKGGSGETEIEITKITPEVIYQLDWPSVVINPGSVGQPRDFDHRASYAILEINADSGRVVFFKVDYDWQEAAFNLGSKGYPESLIRRLRSPEPDNGITLEWVDHLRSIARR